MSNLHLLLDEANKHTPKGFDNAVKNTFPWRDELDQSSYREQMELPKAINFVDGTVAAPTTADGDTYVLIGAGVIDVSWGNATFGDWVKFTNVTANPITPVDGSLCYNVATTSWMEYTAGVWATFGGGGVDTNLQTNDLTLTDPSRFYDVNGNSLQFKSGSASRIRIDSNGVAIGETPSTVAGTALNVVGENALGTSKALSVEGSTGLIALEVFNDRRIEITAETNILGTTTVKNAGVVGTPIFEARGVGTFPLMQVTTTVNNFRPEFTLRNPNTNEIFTKLSGFGPDYVGANLGLGFIGSTAVNIDNTKALHLNGNLRIDRPSIHTNPLVEIGQDPLDPIRPEIRLNVNALGVLRFGGSAVPNYISSNTGIGFTSTTAGAIDGTKQLHVAGDTLIEGNTTIGALAASPSRLTVDSLAGVSAIFKDATGLLLRVGTSGGSGKGSLILYDGGSPKIELNSGAVSYINNGQAFRINGTTGNAALNIHSLGGQLCNMFDANGDLSALFRSVTNLNRFDIYNYGGATIQHRLASNGDDSYVNGVTTANFGVGTNAPTETLHVVGSTLLDGNLGVFGTTPIAQGAALTATLTSTTQAGSFTPDYAIQAVTQTTPFGFVTADEAETLISTVINMQTRIDELEARLDSSTGIGIFT